MKRPLWTKPYLKGDVTFTHDGTTYTIKPDGSGLDGVTPPRPSGLDFELQARLAVEWRGIQNHRISEARAFIAGLAVVILVAIIFAVAGKVAL